MEEAIGVDMDAKIPVAFYSRRKKGKKEKVPEETTNKAQEAGGAGVGERLPESTKKKDTSDDIPSGVTVSFFDYSVENHFRALDTISMLCKEECEFDQIEIQRLSKSITFLREWRHFNYQPRIIRFACQSETPEGKYVTGGLKLPQFSSATVPKENGNSVQAESSKDFVMYVGGPVWALDWCPKLLQNSESDTRSEFLAVAPHPPEFSYHKIGAPLTGRGLIQIWCLLNSRIKEDDVPHQVNKKPKRTSGKSEIPTEQKKPRGRPRKIPVVENQLVEISTQQKKPRGRPRKTPVTENQLVEPCAVQVREDSFALICKDGDSGDSHKQVARKFLGRKRRSGTSPGNDQALPTEDGNNQLVEPCAVQVCEDSVTLLLKEGDFGDTHKQVTRRKRKSGTSPGNGQALQMEDGNNQLSLLNPKLPSSCGQDPAGTSKNVNNIDSSEIYLSSCSTPEDMMLPRVMLCLAHNGKVAWDVKWRPSDLQNSESSHRMGYLAVLLGNGVLEVWEVPSPHAIRVIHSASQKEDTDPRFVKLDPVFRCSMLKCGDRHSIPLTVEWSTSPPNDLILAGCHDGVVALWKFSANGSSKDTRPLLCFSADTVPIRALAWAPNQSDPECANIVVTAGHNGLKFWDIRDPYRPLWDLNPVQRIIYSLDWLPDPRCLLVSYDDGTLRILSLPKAANNAPVTGKPFTGTQQQGFCSYYCSSFTIWSIHISRLTGMVAYCGADGNVIRFQLTHRAVEKDPLRNRDPHFLCGSITEEESTLTVTTPLPDIPFPMKKSLNEWGNAPRTMRGFLSVSNQEKRAKEQMAKGQTSNEQSLALCYGDDLEGESGSEEELVTPKKKKNKAAKTKISNMKNVKADRKALACNPEREDKGGGEFRDEIEVFPSKMVAMHRVRWNNNKGSERWLCSGGACGIVRCQQINASDY